MSVPGVPIINVRPTVTATTADLFWSAPASDGGSAITGYTISCTGGVPSLYVGASTYTVRFTGLSTGTSYTFTITAENTNGSGPAATFRTVQPGNKPGPVLALTPSRAAAPDVQLSWTAPTSNGGAALLGICVRRRRNAG
jgi:hypothetical protein